MIRNTPLIFIMMLSSSMTMAQRGPGDNFKSWYSQAEKLFNLDQSTIRTDSIAAVLYLRAFAPALENRDGKIAVSSLTRAATIRQTHKDFAEATALYLQSIHINNNFFRDTAMLYETCLYLGSVYYQQGMTDSAKFYFEKSSLLSTLKPTPEFPEQERLYNSLGAIYYESANYTQAINYFKKALEFDDDNEESRVILQSNIANCLVELSRYDEAINLFKTLLSSKYIKRIILHNTAHAYFKTGNYDSALKYFNKVSRQNDEVTVRMLIDLGKIYSARNKYIESVKVLDSSLYINNILTGSIRSTDRALNYLVRSTLADKRGESISAMNWCENAFSELLMSGTIRDMNTISPLLMLDVLKHKAFLLEKEYNKTQSASYLEKCFRTWQDAIQVATYIRRYLDNDEAKIYFQKNKGQTFLEATRVGFAWINKKKDHTAVNDLIGVIEAYKGKILYENIQQASLKSGSKIPAAVKLKEKELKQSISYYTVKLGTSTSSSQAAALHHKILSARIELSMLQKQYEKHPEYNFYKQDTIAKDYRVKLAKALSNNTALICYRVTNENIYAFCINSADFQTHIIKVTPELKNDLQTFNSEVYQHTEGKRYGGNRAAMNLYKQLIEPFETVLADKQKLVILPDGMLNYIPFEALVTGKGNRDFLVLHKKISYHYSVSLLLLSHDNASKTGVADNKSLFLAPFAAEKNIPQSDLASLPFSINEVRDMSVTRWIGDKATKKNLLQHLTSNRIIHLATHAKSGSGNDADALIYLYPSDSSSELNNLYLEEIYSLDLRSTELVILSACETAGGYNAAGEGLLSLSRAFMYAGSKGMISTLWKTEDQVSARLMQYLYAGMKKGYPAEEALQMAKVRFLEDEGISEKYKTPNYWSNFIYVGRMGTKVKRSNASWLYVLPLTVVGIFIYSVYKKRKLPRHSRVASVVEP